MTKKSDYLWYANYGSNLLKNRFMCYIEGGRPDGSHKEYKGCTDKTPPKNDEAILIPHKLYFSKQSKGWDFSGVAFIKSGKYHEKERLTKGRIYLIRKQQFIQILRQENSKSPDSNKIKIKEDDFDDIIKYGEKIIESADGKGWYRRIIYLGLLISLTL